MSSLHYHLPLPVLTTNLYTGFHEEVNAKILRVLSDRVIPKLLQFLTKETRAPTERTKKKSISYEEDQVAVQAPIAIAIVNLICRLPEESRQSQLPPVLLRICNTLRNRAMDVRTTSRQTLSTIAADLGPLYLGYIISELRGALQKGYQLHVLANTVHHLLMTLQLDPGQVDNYTLSQIIQIVVDGLVGRTAADRERGENKKSMIPEAKKCYGAQCVERCVSVAAVSQLPLIVEPIKTMVRECTRSKVKLRLEEVLKSFVTGLLQNVLVTPTVALVFAREILVSAEEDQKKGEEGEDEEKQEKREIAERYKRPDIYAIPAAPKRGGTKPKISVRSNSHLLQELALQVLRDILGTSTTGT
eukprot:sb/3466062/